MKAIFIAAGTGKRLGKLTQNTPKPLIEINGKTILDRQISLFRNLGTKNIVIIVGPKSEKFTIKDVDYIRDEKYDDHEQLGSLMVAKSEIYGDVIILFADILFEEKILKQILKSNSDIGIAIDSDWEKSYGERYDNSKSEADKVLIKDNQVLLVSKNISQYKNNESIAEFIGLVKLSKKGSELWIKKYDELESNHSGRFHDASSFKKAKLIDMLQELLNSKIEITPIFIKGKWCEIDTPNDLERAKKLFT